MRKLLLSLVIVLFFSFTLAACIQNDEVEGNGEIYEGEWEVLPEGHNVSSPTEIEFWSANSAVDIHGTVMAELVKRFNAYQKQTYPGSFIKVNVSFQGGYINQNQKLQAALISETNPDMAMIGVSSMALYKDSVLDVRNYLTFDQIRQVHEGFLQFAMYQNVFIGYPYFAASNVILLNRTEANKTNLRIQTPSEIIADPANSTWDWEQYQELAKQMTHKMDDDKTFYGLSASSPALYEGWFTQGVSVYNQTATKANIDNQEGLNVLTMWQDLVKNGYMENPVLNPNHGTQIQANFIEGKTGMLFASSSAVRQVFSNVDGKFEIDVLPHPKKTDFYANQSGGGLVIFNNKNDARKAAVVEFFRWLFHDDQQVYYSTNTGYLATTKTATTHPDWLAYKEINPLLDAVVQIMALGVPEGTQLPIGRAKALADDDFAKYAKGIYYTKQVGGETIYPDIQTILTETQERVGYLLDSNS